MPDKELSTLDQARLDAFKAVMTRCRWLLLTTILIACLMLVHLFTTEFGYQTHQLKRTLLTRLKHDPTAFLAADSTASSREGVTGVLLLGPGPKARENVSKYRRDKRDADAREAVEAIYSRLLMNRALADLQLRDSVVPLLGVSVPANDYVAIMTWMLMIFSTALWLAVRALEGTLRSVAAIKPLIELVKLHVTFTGLSENKPGAGVAIVLQYCALWLPVAIFGFAWVLDMAPPAMAALKDPRMVMGDPVYVWLRAALFGVASLWLVGLAVSNSGRMKRLDKLVYGKAGAESV